MISDILFSRVCKLNVNLATVLEKDFLNFWCRRLEWGLVNVLITLNTTQNKVNIDTIAKSGLQFFDKAIGYHTSHCGPMVV